jgi:hypothetical protein
MMLSKIKKISGIVWMLIILFSARSAQALNNPAPGLFPDLSLGDNITVAGIIMYIITRILLPLVGLISMLFIIIGGFQFITARGDEEAASAGKKTLTNAIIGLVIVILSYIIVTVTINALKGSA